MELERKRKIEAIETADEQIIMYFGLNFLIIWLAKNSVTAITKLKLA